MRELNYLDLPKFKTINKKSGQREFFFENKKFEPCKDCGARPKQIFLDYGIIVKFQTIYDYTRHDDLKFYCKIEEQDLIYFPKLYYDDGTYSIHEFVAHKRDVSDEDYKKAEELSDKYGFNDFRKSQIGTRLDNGKLVYFDYGLADLKI
ncbi:MAG TPA: hypothetical protein PLP33_27200 [Leptospiraceae bacterium]|nr:hypothetical protein [Leptospiraceae bacterium]